MNKIFRKIYLLSSRVRALCMIRVASMDRFDCIYLGHNMCFIYTRIISTFIHKKACVMMSIIDIKPLTVNVDTICSDMFKASDDNQ